MTKKVVYQSIIFATTIQRDDIIFEDIIDKIQFNPNENNTSLFFLLDNEYIEWKFNGNITNKYKKEDRINASF